MRRFPRFEQSLLTKEYAEVGLPSPVQGNLELHHKVEKRKQAGDVINLSIMTDQDAPARRPDCRRRAGPEGRVYQERPPVRKKICDFYAQDRGARFDPETEIFLTTGSQLGLDSAFKLLIDPGDEVLMGEPEYADLRAHDSLLRGQGHLLPARAQGNDLDLHLAAFEKAVTPRTKLVVMSHPNNPWRATSTAARSCRQSPGSSRPGAAGCSATRSGPP